MIQGLKTARVEAAGLTQDLAKIGQAAATANKQLFFNPSPTPGLTFVPRQSGNGVDVGIRTQRTAVRFTAGGGRSNVSSFGTTGNFGGGNSIVSTGVSVPATATGPVALAPTSGGDATIGKLLAVQTQQLLILQRIDAKLDGGGARERLEGLV